MSTSLTSELRTEWEAWHLGREQALRTPHGWLSLTAFHWLPESPSPLPGLPGLFSARDGEALLTATVADGYAVILADNALPEALDRNVAAEVAEARSLEWLTLGDVLIELVLRGGRYAIRTRDPEAATRSAFGGVPIFPFDEKWLLTGGFEPFASPRKISVDTARSDLTQEITGVGTVTLEVDGRAYRLIATSGAAETLNLAFNDTTNGSETAGWRAVSTTAPDVWGRVRIDFNRAVNFPYAFTDYGTCPAPPKGNALPFAVTAGELAPVNVVSVDHPTV